MGMIVFIVEKVVGVWNKIYVDVCFNIKLVSPSYRKGRNINVLCM